MSRFGELCRGTSKHCDFYLRCGSAVDSYDVSHDDKARGGRCECLHYAFNVSFSALQPPGPWSTGGGVLEDLEEEDQSRMSSMDEGASFEDDLRLALFSSSSSSSSHQQRSAFGSQQAQPPQHYLPSTDQSSGSSARSANTTPNP